MTQVLVLEFHVPPSVGQVEELRIVVEAYAICDVKDRMRIAPRRVTKAVVFFVFFISYLRVVPELILRI